MCQVFIILHQLMVYVHVLLCYHRYSRGLGLIGPLLGEDHPLNVPNALAGIVYYTIMMFLSECIYVAMYCMTQELTGETLVN